MAKLHFRYGAMNGGKSTQIIQTAFNYEEVGDRPYVMKPNIDTKGAQEVVSRAGNLRRAVDFAFSADDDLYEHVGRQTLLRRIAAVLIDEVQFASIPQVEQAFAITAELDIPVLTWGLRCDSNGDAFPASARLMTLADDLKEVETMCASQACGNQHNRKKARHNIRITNGQIIFDGPQIQIDDEASQQTTTYVSFCKECMLSARAEQGLPVIGSTPRPQSDEV